MPTPGETDYYVLLGVDPGAGAVAIRKAVVGAQRRCGARQNAPDLATRQDAERQAQLLTDVRDVLLDPGLRALYDIQRVEALPDWPDPALRPSPLARPGFRTPRSGWLRRLAGAGVAAALLLFLTTRASIGTLPTPMDARPAPARALDASSSTGALAASLPATPVPREAVPAAGVRGQVYVAATDGQGVFLSATPSRGDRLTAWPEGSQLEVVGDDVTADGLVWAAVRTSDGQAGFVPRQYVSAHPPASANPPAASTQPPTPPPTRPPVVARPLPDEVPVTLSGPPLTSSILPLPTQPFSLAGGHYTVAWAAAGRQPCDFVITIADPIAPGLIRTTLSNHVLNRSDGQPAQGQTSVHLNSGKYRLEAYSDTCSWSLVLSAAS